jgi:glycosyltransferase involved in cell wall biosynthesis
MHTLLFMRKVLIATPAYTGEVNIKYTISLVNTIRLSIINGIQIDIAYTTGDALVQKTRNYLLTLAIERGFDDLIFIDDDIEWDPEWIFKMLNYPVDVVGGVYRKKFDDCEAYAVRLTEPIQGDSRTGLMKANGLNTGFLRLSRKACTSLWAISEPYDSGILPSERMVFDLKIENGTLYSEDYIMSHKLRKLGFDLWIDPRMGCVHHGPKAFGGHFIKWLEDSGRFQK